jgi:hypothetical protein
MYSLWYVNKQYNVGKFLTNICISQQHIPAGRINKVSYLTAGGGIRMHREWLLHKKEKSRLHPVNGKVSVLAYILSKR